MLDVEVELATPECTIPWWDGRRRRACRGKEEALAAIPRPEGIALDVLANIPSDILGLTNAVAGAPTKATSLKYARKTQPQKPWGGVPPPSPAPTEVLEKCTSPRVPIAAHHENSRAFHPANFN